MNKVVRGIYKVEDLPAGLREALKPAEMAEITATALPAEQQETVRLPGRSLLAEMGIDLDKIKPLPFSEIWKMAGPGSVTVDEAVERIRKLRDEWDD